MKCETRTLNPRNFFRQHTNFPTNDKTIVQNKAIPYLDVSDFQSAFFVEKSEK